MLLEAPGTVVDERGEFRLGRFRQPILDPDFRPARVPGLPRWLRRWRLKEWHGLFVCSDEWYLGVALAQLGYLANVFLYLVHRPTGQVAEYGARTPLGLGLAFAPSSVNGTTRFQQKIRIDYQDGWMLDLNLRLAGRPLEGRIHVERQSEAGVLVHPLPGHRAAYTHKEAGNRASGSLQWGDRNLSFEPAWAVMDWTRSYARRNTVWNWLAVAGPQVGINLSARVYDDRENFAWVDGRVYALGPATFEIPRGPEPWHVHGPEFELWVTPAGARRENVQLGLIAARFQQPYGPIRGRLRLEGRELELADLYGVVEDHWALW